MAHPARAPFGASGGALSRGGRLLLLLMAAIACACAEHGAVHVAPDESRPHVTWEIRTGTDLGDEDLVCGSAQPSPECVLTASTGQRSALATVHVYLHAAAQETSYLGAMTLPFIEGTERDIGREVTATVPPRSRPVGMTVTGRVTSKPGSYTFSVSLDANQPGMATPQRIAVRVPVVVKS